MYGSRVVRHEVSLFMNVHYANVTQVKWSVQVCFLQQYSYGPRPQPSSKIVELAERIAALSPEERKQIGHALSKHLRLQEQQMISF